MFKTIITTAVLALGLTGLAQAAGDAEAGKGKIAVCASCHGQDGVALMPMYPNLHGQNAPYLESALKAYREGQRGGGMSALMTPMAANLTDADIADIAAYFSSLK